MTRTPANDRVAGDALGRGEAVEHRHPDVHEQHVGAVRLCQRDGLLPGRRLPDEFEVLGVLHLQPEAVADHRLVVGDADPDPAHRFAWSGRWASTTHAPPPTATPETGPLWTVPPTWAARSRMPTRPCPRVPRVPRVLDDLVRTWVADPDEHLVGDSHRHLDPLAAPVAHDVGEGFLEDAVGRVADLGPEAVG